MLRVQLPLSVTFLLPPIFLSLILTGVMLLPTHIQQELFLSSTDFQLFTLLSAQLLHHDWAHYGLNMGGIWLWWALFAESIPKLRYWLGLPVIMVFSSAAEFLFNSNFSLYAGFSGTLYGLFAYSGVSELRQKKWIGSLVFLGVLVKLTIDFSLPEVSAGLALFAHVGGVVAGGVLALVVPRSIDRKRGE
ncbi:rhomboid family intramembrane serine protease [Pseudidiomarina sp.]|uniref:rhomboid family intramembrane serine protease n=1 Tax=Pseudidiomarina sp. TaxID=2081707 RepID=UPI003A96DAA2